MSLRDFLFKTGYIARIHRLVKPGFKKKPVTSLCLHRVSPKPDQLFPPLDPGVFAKLLRLLKKEYTIISLSAAREVMAMSSPGSKPYLIITFDDGYRDFFAYALPVVVAEKVSVNHNIVADCAETGKLVWTQRINNILSFLEKLGTPIEFEYSSIRFKREVKGNLAAVKRELFTELFKQPYTFLDGLAGTLELQYQFSQPANDMMNWEEISECHKAGVEIGSHSYFHGPLVNYNDSWITEIAGSKKVIEEKINAPVKTFAFPNGLVHPVAYQMAVDAGYENLLLIEGARNESALKLNPNAGNFERLLVGHSSVYENIFNITGFHKAIRR